MSIEDSILERMETLEKRNRWMKRIDATVIILELFFTGILVSATVFAQTNPKSKSGAAPSISLSKPKDMGISDIRMFAEEQKVRFVLVTSWIPGEKNQGMFRYKLTVFVPKEDSTDSSKDKSDESAEKLLNRVNRCAITLVLYDKDTFISRKHEVPFIRGVDEQARFNALLANDTFQMSDQEYREFINSGSWSILWSCFP